MKKYFAIAAAFGLAFAAAPAAAQEFVPDRTLLENFDGPDVGMALDGLEADWSKATFSDGSPYYSITFPSGLIATATPTVCQSPETFSQCSGLRLTASFDKPSAKSVADLGPLVNTYNLGHVATLATYTDDGESQLSMYLICDFGITRSNLLAQIAVFQSSAERYSQTLYN